jgi:hypothetical protein
LSVQTGYKANFEILVVHCQFIKPFGNPAAARHNWPA